MFHLPKGSSVASVELFAVYAVVLLWIKLMYDFFFPPVNHLI
jgi:hypothetical protein